MSCTVTFLWRALQSICPAAPSQTGALVHWFCERWFKWPIYKRKMATVEGKEEFLALKVSFLCFLYLSLNVKPSFCLQYIVEEMWHTPLQLFEKFWAFRNISSYTDTAIICIHPYRVRIQRWCWTVAVPLTSHIHATRKGHASQILSLSKIQWWETCKFWCYFQIMCFKSNFSVPAFNGEMQLPACLLISALFSPLPETDV